MTNNATSDMGPRSEGKYSNFRDPFGLLTRMLLSGNRAAYDALLRAGLSIGLSPIDWAMQSRERSLLREVDPDAPPEPQVLIVGPPRSGSTLLYQTLARYTNATYLSNLTDLFPRSPITATRWYLEQKKPRRKNFSNYYGQTAGLASPNDGFALWNRWLGTDRYITPETLSPEANSDMSRFFAAWSATFHTPFLNKNNRNAFCLRLLAETLPNAHFIIIRRDPLFIAQSLIEARRQVQGSKDIPWGLASSENHTLAGEPLGYVDDVCDQLFRIKNRLEEQQSAVHASRYVETSYESFCADPAEELRRISANINRLRLDESLIAEELTPFSLSASIRLSKQELEKIQRRFEAVPAWHVQAKSREVKEAQ